MSLLGALKNIVTGKSIDGEKPSLLNQISTPKELKNGEEPDLLRRTYDTVKDMNDPDKGGIIHKNPATEIFREPYEYTKTASKFIKFGNLKIGETIMNWVSTAYTGVLRWTFNQLPVRLLGIVAKTRDDISETLENKIGKDKIEKGAQQDKALAEWLAEKDLKYGATDVEVEEGQWFAETRKAFSEWARNTAIPELNRYPNKPDSDEDFIKREERDQAAFSAKIDSEKAYEVPPYHGYDMKLISALGGRINANRGDTLRIDRAVCDTAARRASYIMNNEAEKPVPISYLYHPPIKRLEISEEIKPTRMIGDRPQFENLTAEKRRRIVPGSIKKNANGTYNMAFKEKDSDFAKRIREVHAVRRPFSDQYDDFSLVLNINDIEPEGGDHKWIGDPEWILSKVMENAEHKLALLSPKQTLGIGIQRAGSKVVITFLLTKDSKDESEPVLTEPLVLPEGKDMDQWWFDQIAPEYRQEGTTLHKIFTAEPGSKDSFRSGYSLYQFSLFKKEIDLLKADGKEIEIEHIEPYREMILFKEHDVLLIKMKINKQEHMVKLLRGTDLVDIPEKEASRKGKATEKSIGNYIPLSEYYKQIASQPGRTHSPQAFVTPEGEQVDATPVTDEMEEDEDEDEEEERRPYAANVTRLPGARHPVRRRNAA